MNWYSVSDGFNFGSGVQAIAIHPTEENTVFASTNTEIVKTIDGGATWNIVLTQSGMLATTLSFHPSSPDTIFAAAETGLLKSADGGMTWATLLSGEFYDMQFQPNNGTIAYALGRNTTTDQYEFYKSTDGGTTFSLSMSGWGTYYEHSGAKMALTTADNQYLYVVLLTQDGTGNENKPYILKSTDAGSTWVTVATGLTTEFPMNNGQGYYDLAILINDENKDELVVGTQIIYKSTDGGANFVTLADFSYTNTLPLHPDLQSAKCAGGKCWLATDGGMNYSSDFFSSLVNHDTRNKGITGSQFWGYSQGWNEDFFVGGRYHNGNTYWHENFAAGENISLGGAESATGWALPGRTRHAFFDDIGEKVLPEYFNESIVSGSFNFSKHPNKVYGARTSRLLNSVEHFNTYYTGEGTTFWKSADGGAQWTSIGEFSDDVWYFDRSRSNPTAFYVFTGNGFHKTTNEGTTWTDLTNNLPAGFGNFNYARVSISATNENEVWILKANATTGDKIFKSTDGGLNWTNWTTASLDGRNFRAMIHQAGTDGGVYLASLRGAGGTFPTKVYYRNNNLADWVDITGNLPAGLSPLKILPF